MLAETASNFDENFVLNTVSIKRHLRIFGIPDS